MTPKQKLMLGSATIGLCVVAPLAQLDAQAFNATPKTVAGNVTYDRATPGVETVFVETDSAIINWTPTPGTFLPAGNTATYSNGINTTNFAVLNRILTTTPVRFDGTVLSRIQNLAVGTSDPGGTVIFSSPGGIIIGPTAIFDVGNLILTSLNVVDNSGDFGGTSGNYQFDNGAAFPNAAIITQAGSQFTALNQGSYIAFVAPQVIHGGTLRANGSVGYVAGEALQLRVNNGLFDIIVTVGSANATPIIHTGSTGGPASNAADDVQRIYMVAVPKNQAITAILEGNVGFDPAVVAGLENGAIVLSAGHSVVGGNVDRFALASPPPTPDLTASFHIRGGRITSDLTGVAVTDMLASGQTTGSLIVQQDIRLFADGRAHLFAGAGQTVTVAGDALISTARLNSADKNATDLTGGEALVFAQGGGSVTINGDLTVTAAAQGRTNGAGVVGSGTGGAAGIFADQGNVQINGDVVIDATGAGAKPPAGAPFGGNGTGGTALVEGRNGGNVQINGSLGVDASGTASEASGVLPATGAIGLGGTIRLGTTGPGTVAVTGVATLATDGRGGAMLSGAGNNGGFGRGGDILVTMNGGTINLNVPGGISANGFGGFGPIGGTGQGGTIVFDVTGAQFQFGGAAALTAAGTGGDSAIPGGQGGNGIGGAVRLTVHNGGAGSRIGAGSLAVDVTGTGGVGGNFVISTPAGGGGSGRGGDVVLLAEAGNAVLDVGALAGTANGQGGRGGAADNDVDGGDGGDGQGGTVQIGTAPTAAPTVTGNTRFASVNLRANGLGGSGGLGQGSGGNATGGSAIISAGGAPVLVAGATDLEANGVAGPGGVGAVAGVGATGQGAGGQVRLSASGPNGTLNAGTVNGTASATGAAAVTNLPGEWHIDAGTGGAINLANLNLTAAANGVVGVPAFSSLEPLGGTINVTQVANLITPGEIRVLGDGVGRIIGGRYNLTAGTDVTMTHASPAAGGFTFDVADLFIVAGDDFSAGAGVVTRTSNQTDIRAADNASVAGQIVGANVLLRAASLDVAPTGGVGNATTTSTDVRATGNANVAGQIQGQAIVLRSAGLNVAGTGAIGAAATNSSDILATGAATIAGQIQGGAIVLRSAALDVGATGLIGSAATTSADVQATGNANVAGQIRGGTITLRSAGLNLSGAVGGAETTLADVGATGNATVAGQVQAATVSLRSGGTLDVAATGSIGTAATASTDVRATGNANVSGRIQGQAIVLRSAGLNIGAGGAVGGAGTNTADILATGAATVAGQIGGRSILLNAASLDLAVTGSIGNGAATDLSDVRVTGNAAIAGQIQGQTIVLRSAALNVAGTGAVGGATTNSTDILATGDATVAGQIGGRSVLLSAASLDLAATGSIGNGASTNLSDVRTAGNAAIAGQVTGGTVRITSAAINIAATSVVGGAATNQAELRATGMIGVAGRLVGANILVASSEIDLSAGGAIGDAATQLVALQPNATGQTVTLGGTTQGAGYTLTGAEAGRIRAATLRIDAPGVAAGNALLIRDVTFNGGGAASGIGILEINTPGITRVEGALLLANAAAGNGISISSRERIEVPTSTGSIRVRTAAGAPGGTMLLQSNNIWVASPAILAQLGANANYAGRDADLLSSAGSEAERGYVEADRVVLATGGTLYVQNSGPIFSPAYAGITNGPGGLFVRATAPAVNVNAFGRRLNGDGSVTLGDAWFFQVNFQGGGAAGGGFAAGATFNTCIIPTGQCPARAPGNPVPGRDPTTGPTGGSDSILLPPGAEADDLVDTSFAAEGLIEEPVTSGGDGGLWETDCDRDNDGDCDEDGR